jgi:hypothetical protein
MTTLADGGRPVDCTLGVDDSNNSCQFIFGTPKIPRALGGTVALVAMAYR